MRHRLSPLGAWLLVGGCFVWGCDSVLSISPPEARNEDAGGEGGNPEAGAPGTPWGGDGGRGGDTDLITGGGGATGGSAGESGTSGEGGESGDGAVDCTFGELRCGGADLKTPESCDEAGTWVIDAAQTQGADCELGCVDGRCLECAEDERTCDDKVPLACENGFWVPDEACPSYCLEGTCRTPPSCLGDLKCGDDESCCSAHEVPGGTFARRFDDEVEHDYVDPATVSTFLLDEFEVTVGRFRNFVSVYPIALMQGDGKAPYIDGDTGWPGGATLPATQDDLKALLNCAGATWTDDTGLGVANRPINCVPWLVAYAFCIWDGGRLPTEAEWQYAAAGGEQQRLYPWSEPPENPSALAEHAYFGPAPWPPLPVGSKVGHGRWGHADLGGNLYEWVLDTYLDTYSPSNCIDCAHTAYTGFRTIRGGAFSFWKEDMLTASRTYTLEDDSYDYLGFRCARNVVGAEAP